MMKKYNYLWIKELEKTDNDVMLIAAMFDAVHRYFMASRRRNKPQVISFIERYTVFLNACMKYNGNEYEYTWDFDEYHPEKDANGNNIINNMHISDSPFYNSKDRVPAKKQALLEYCFYSSMEDLFNKQIDLREYNYYVGSNRYNYEQIIVTFISKMYDIYRWLCVNCTDEGIILELDNVFYIVAKRAEYGRPNLKIEVSDNISLESKR